MKKLSSKQKRELKALAAKPDSEIDLTDIPEVVDWSGAAVGKFCRGNFGKQDLPAKVVRVKRRKRG